MTVLYLLLGLLLGLPTFVVALEYNHYWTKLYNWWVDRIPCISGYKLPKISYKSEPNSVKHQSKMFFRWLMIGAAIFLIIVMFIPS